MNTIAAIANATNMAMKSTPADRRAWRAGSDGGAGCASRGAGFTAGVGPLALPRVGVI